MSSFDTELAALAESFTEFGSAVQLLLLARVKNSDITASLAVNGWVKIPVQVAGSEFTLIIQTGLASIPTGNQDPVTFPIAFPTGIMRILAVDAGAGCNSVAAVENGLSKTNFFGCGKAAGGTAYSSTSYSFLALGW